MTTRSTTILGVTFELPVPYAAGHTVNEAEADSLNQTVVQNIGNNFRDKIKSAKEAGALEAVTAEIMEYAKTYRLNEGSGARGPRGPQDEYRDAGTALAKIEVQQAAAAAGEKMSAKDMVDMAKQLYTLDRDRFVREVDKQRKAAARSSDGGLLAKLRAAKAEAVETATA